MTRKKDTGASGNPGEFASKMHPEAEGMDLTSFLHEAAIARKYGQKTVTAVGEMIRLTDVGASLVARGRGWYDGDPDNVPGLACEGLIIRVGENVSRVSDHFKDDHPEVPWQVIKDMRNRLTHYYESTNYEVVWDTLAEDFPVIRAQMRGVLGRTD